MLSCGGGVWWPHLDDISSQCGHPLTSPWPVAQVRLTVLQGIYLQGGITSMAKKVMARRPFMAMSVTACLRIHGWSANHP